ncbi:MAG: hypothetical protein Kow0098_22290 [Ignavibacteriaceae bacterium]
MKNYYINLFNYNDWANDAALKSIEAFRDDKLLRIFSHIINAQFLWLGRILEPKKLNPWDEMSLEECFRASKASTEEWLRYLEQTDDTTFGTLIRYTNTRGENFTNSVKVILTHVINHSSYHRGQIAMMVRNLGGEPAATDYIIFERSVK